MRIVWHFLAAGEARTFTIGYRFRGVTVAYDDVLTWTANGKCPSLKPCLLTCNDGTQSMSQQYLAMVCEGLTVDGAFCKKHGGVHTVYYDSLQVWPGPQP